MKSFVCDDSSYCFGLGVFTHRIGKERFFFKYEFHALYFLFLFFDCANRFDLSKTMNIYNRQDTIGSASELFTFTPPYIPTQYTTIMQFQSLF